MPLRIGPFGWLGGGLASDGGTPVASSDEESWALGTTQWAFGPGGPEWAYPLQAHARWATRGSNVST